MKNPERRQYPVSPDQLPPEARHYFEVIDAHERHPFVEAHFDRLNWLVFGDGTDPNTSCFAVEFHANGLAALAWQAEDSHWGAGAWLRLPHPGADITCCGISAWYFQGSPAFESFAAVLAHLESTIPRREPLP